MELLFSIIYTGMTGLISFYVGTFLPRTIFNEEKFPYKSFEFERHGKIYDKLNIRKWKGEIIDMSKIMKIILPKQISVSATAKDIYSLVKETCVAEAVHWVLCIISVGNVWIWKSVEGILVWILCIIGNLPFIFVQRYNRPHLMDICEKMARREKLRKSEG